MCDKSNKKNDLTQAVSFALRMMMRKNKVSQKDLADILGLSEQTINNRLNGRTQLTLDFISEICEVMQVDASIKFGNQGFEIGL